MAITIKVSNGEPVLPREVWGASTGASSVEPTLPSVSGSRHNPRYRGQKRNNWYNKRRNDKGKQPQQTPQPEDNRRQDQEQHLGQRQYQPQPQPQPQHQHRAPVKVVLERPDYFNYNPSDGLHTPGQIYPDAYAFAAQPVGYFPALPSTRPMLMSIPPSPPHIGQFDPSMAFAVMTAEYPKRRLWDDEMREVFPMWSPPQRPVDPLKVWPEVRFRQAGYHPLYYRASTLRPWANEFVPGRLFHPILGW